MAELAASMLIEVINFLRDVVIFKEIKLFLKDIDFFGK